MHHSLFLFLIFPDLDFLPFSHYFIQSLLYRFFFFVFLSHYYSSLISFCQDLFCFISSITFPNLLLLYSQDIPPIFSNLCFIFSDGANSLFSHMMHCVLMYLKCNKMYSPRYIYIYDIYITVNLFSTHDRLLYFLPRNL